MQIKKEKKLLMMVSSYVHTLHSQQVSNWAIKWTISAIIYKPGMLKKLQKLGMGCKFGWTKNLGINFPN